MSYPYNLPEDHPARLMELDYQQAKEESERHESDVAIVWNTPRLRDILMHALGSSHVGAKLGFRNYFCAESGDADCETLVDVGLMKRGKQINEGTLTYYCVSDEGKRLCGVKP